MATTIISAVPRPLSDTWPTWAVAAGVYAGWGLATWFWASLPLWLLVPLGGWLVAWHGSLQHETIHHHPTRHSWLNAVLGWPPLSLWIPYPLYRDSHLAHHRDRNLTCPIEDPESFYISAEAWRRMGVAGRWLRRANQRLLGRLVLGPWLTVWFFGAHELRLILAGDRRRLGVWAAQAAGLAALFGWVSLVCGMPWWLYVLAFAYPGLSLTLLRSFAEHRPNAAPDRRTAMVVSGPVLSLLFLNNNLHTTHHARPGVPWHRLPAIAGATRDEAAEGGGLYVGYRDVFRRYLLRPIAHPVHPGSCPDQPAAA